MKNRLVQITIDFRKKYYAVAKDVAAAIVYGRIVDKVLIEKKLVAAMVPVIDELFIQGQVVSNKLVGENIAKLVVDYNIPYKYNKDLLLRMNDKSIFTGYYDRTYKSVYSKGEIDRLKRVILTAKYGEWSETKTIQAISNTARVTTKRAMLLARHETARLTTVANQLYFSKTEVHNSYDLIWRNSGDNVRPAHAVMAGQKADKDGNFKSSLCGVVSGPPLACDPWNCKCFTEFVEKDSS